MLTKIEMPTAKPRITVTLDENQHRLLSTLAELQGVSMSSILVDLLDTVVPVLERVATVLKSAKDAPAAVRAELKRTAETAEAQITPFAQEVMGQLDLLINTGSGGGAGDSSAAPAPAQEGPPASNRGVRISPPPSKVVSKPKKKRAVKA